MQATIRATHSLTLNLGVRYDLQAFQAGNLVTNPLYLPSGKIPTETHNFSPRFGFAYNVGERNPWVIRGGGGIYYMQIPSMYASQVATDNGITQSQLLLDMMVPAQAAVFPSYPNPLVNCAPGAASCTPPASVAGLLTTQISAFSPNFQTPYTEQATSRQKNNSAATSPRLPATFTFTVFTCCARRT
ncbi:MAG: TonB-dependent receptor [Acidobacteriota bacterium]|nr:TonB-dependent receptor [Acidobacteriota bacterium]